jgi:hypothetical protein
MTLDQTSTQFAVQWRAYVSDAFQRSSEASFYDWSALNAGAVYDPTAETAITWSALDIADGTLDIHGDLDNTWSGAGWRVTMTGALLPATVQLLHMLLIQRREATGAKADWGDWVNERLGWITAIKATDNAGRGATWEVTVAGIDGVLEQLHVPGLHVGALDVARSGSASGSTQLAMPYKEALSGEFTVANPQTGADQAMDGNLDTLYVSERHVGTGVGGDANRPGTGAHGLDLIHIAPYVGQGPGYRYIQFDMGAHTTGIPHIANTAGAYPIMDGKYSAGIVILVENETLFRAENPAAGDVAHDVQPQVIELKPSTVSSWGGGGTDAPSYWDGFDPAAGSCSFDGASVSWGTGGLLAAPKSGETIRRIWANSASGSSGWEVGPIASPGYYISDEEQLWWLIQAPGMGLTLADDLDGSSTADLLLRQGDVYGTDWLPASGTIQIENEQIHYTAKRTDYNGLSGTITRGYGGTTAASHKAGSPIYVVEDSVAVDGPPILSVVIKRASGKPVPKNFAIFGSRSTVQPPTPPDDYWFDSWTDLQDVSGNSANPYTYTIGTANKRYKWILIEATAMTTNPYRLMLNTVQLLADSSTINAAGQMAASTVYAIAKKILNNAGIPNGAIVDGGSTPTLDDITTAPGPAMRVLQDLMDLSGCYISVGPDSKITIGRHPLWTGAGYPSPAIAWTRTTLAEYTPDWAPGRDCGQIELQWQALDGSDRGVVRYPDVPDPYGEIIKVGPFLFADAAAALTAATKRYWQRRIKQAFTGKAAGAPIGAGPGLAYGVTWTLGNQASAMARTYFVDSVTHRLEVGGLETAFHGVQVGLEDET